ncbi:hypothetical protein FY036_22325 [Mesorhizobium microcysteis]|uniref:Uncharacterized protein n=1 Tax=Neoaquamicrobium microcysteis TaxID=2682781 RepID=A0A5D4GSP3_9HYPH|nr:hypothetical protein [Mesorhizobium microcysteis]TYR29590.1 hypothetical protein FY036_22325 [Mesorhizobium microcysteis]
MAGNSNQRFEAIEEPMGGWMVWDNARDFPAEFGEIVLVGLTGSTASEMTEILNDAAKRRPKAQPSRHARSEVIALHLRRSEG